MTTRLSQWLTVFVVLFALPVLAGSRDAGAWVGTVREKELHLSLHPKDEPGSQMGFSAPLTAFQGLSSAEGSTAPFKLVREAGTFDFEGRFAQEQGTGTWRFTPNAAYTKALTELGLPKPDAEQQFALATVGVGPERIKSLAAAGYRVTTVDELIQVGIFNVTPEYAKALAAEGYTRLSVEQLAQTRIHGVTPERIKALAAAGFKGLDLDTLLSMSIHGVTPDFIREMRGLGFKELKADDLVSMRIHGVTPAFVNEMRGLGYTSATAEDLMQLRIHGVDSVFVRSMSKDGGAPRKQP